MDVERFFRLFGFFSVLLRAGTLIFQSLAIGGVVFLTAILGPSEKRAPDLANTIRRGILVFAVALAITEAVYAATDVFILVASGGLSISDAIGANFAVAAGLAIASAVALAFLCSRERLPAAAGTPAMVLLAVLILVGSVMTSHSVARMENRALLAALTGLHQGATAVWIGGLPFLVLLLFRARDAGLARSVSQRFSILALSSVAVLSFAGLGLTVNYVRAWSGLYETAYGVMVVAKVLLFLCLLGLGALNFFGVRAARADQPAEAAHAS